MFYHPRGSDGHSRRYDPAHGAHSGLRVVRRLVYRHWEILIDHHTAGMMLRRDRYNARLLDELHGREEYLRGFASANAAIEAALRRIDFLKDIRDPRMFTSRTYRRPRQVPVDS